MRSRFRHGPHGVPASQRILEALQGRQARADLCLSCGFTLGRGIEARTVFGPDPV